MFYNFLLQFSQIQSNFIQIKFILCDCYVCQTLLIYSFPLSYLFFFIIFFIVEGIGSFVSVDIISHRILCNYIKSNSLFTLAILLSFFYLKDNFLLIIIYNKHFCQLYKNLPEKYLYGFHLNQHFLCVSNCSNFFTNISLLNYHNAIVPLLQLRCSRLREVKELA